MRGASPAAGDDATPAASRTSRSTSRMKMFVRAATASGRSLCAKNHRSRQG